MVLFRYLLLFASFNPLVSATTSAIKLATTSCAPPQPLVRNNPRPLDCMSAITYIVSTALVRSDTILFTTAPTSLLDVKVPFGHSFGTCIALVVPGPSTSAPVTSSWDEVVRVMLSVVGQCLLNNQPEQWNWGGGALGGAGNGLTIALQGTMKPRKESNHYGNSTLQLNDVNSWVESLLPS